MLDSPSKRSKKPSQGVAKTFPNSLHFCVSLFILLLSTLLISPVSSCMPGYEGERARLRQYLGIEWTPQGLDQMDAKPAKHVSEPSDLNCDFSAPEKCRWKNIKGLDSLDFFLFRKEDYTEFPVVQVRPGPSKVAVGEQLIFTGDNKKDEKSTVLASHPIKCQNTTGKLTFTFWIYNGARVEVLILEEDSDHQLNALPEKPQINCGTLQVDTECSVEIPPREQSFRIGIRAYDIRNRDGSFVMLDNILYEAQFCKLSINFGQDFHTEPLITGAMGEFVKTSGQLNCTDFDAKCRWRNGGSADDRAVWKKATSLVTDTVFFNETGTYTQPTVPFAFVYIEEGRAPREESGRKVDGSTATGYKMLVSDPVQCLSSAASTISFRAWSTRGIELEICVIDMEMNVIECQKVSMARSPAPVSHRFQISKPFMYAFRLASVNADFDNFVIVDEISHDAATCAEASNQFDLGSDFYTTPILSVLRNRPIHSTNDLTCDFSRRALDCQWANLEGQVDTRWEVGLGQIDPVKFASLTNGQSSPGSDIAVAKLHSPNSTAVLISERIQCLVEASSLSFKYWRTGSPSLSVCIVESSSFEVVDCQSIDSWNMDQVIVDIPRFGEAIRIALKADSYSGTGMVAVDSIFFDGKICQSIAFSGKSGVSGVRGSTRPSALASDYPNPTALQHSIPDENVCRLLSCNFDRGHMCLYSSFRVGASVSMFRPFNGTEYLLDRSKMAVLESPVFKLNAPARLHFDFTIAKGATSLHICQDSSTRELDSCFTVVTAKQGSSTQLGTFHDFIQILPTDMKIYIIAKLNPGSRKASVTLDNIELLDSENHRIC